MPEVVARGVAPAERAVVASADGASTGGGTAPAREHAREPGWFAAAGRVLVGVALAMGLFELVLRQFYFIPWEMDPEFGCIVEPGAKTVYRREGNGTGLWTLKGARRAAPLPAGARPILALGDSFTEAYMLDDEQVFTARAEAALAAEAHPIPLLNLGSSGQSAADYVADAARNVRVFQPRWVVIQLRDDDLEDDAWAAGKTHFARTSAGGVEAVPVDDPPQSAFREAVFKLRRRSALLNYTIIRLLEYQHGWDAEAPLFRAGSVAAAPPPPPSYPIAEELEAMSAAYGGRVTFLLLAAFDPAHPDAPTETEQRFAIWCGGGSRSCVNLREAYRRFASEYQSPYGFANSGFNVGHLNAAGHAAAGRLLARELERLVGHGLL